MVMSGKSSADRRLRSVIGDHGMHADRRSNTGHADADIRHQSVGHFACRRVRLRWSLSVTTVSTMHTNRPWSRAANENGPFNKTRDELLFSLIDIKR
jgi:hypothetical protein